MFAAQPPRRSKIVHVMRIAAFVGCAGALMGPTVPPTASAPAYWPEVSPDGRHVLYVSPARGGPIHIMNADGSDSHLLARGTRAAWFPDGERIVVVARSKPESHLVIMRANGTAPDTIPRGFPPVLWRPRVSPDGKTVVFGNISPRPGAFYFIALDGTELQTIHPDGAGQCEEPTWSHDGRLAYVCFERDSTEQIRSTTLHVMNADASGERTLARMNGGAQWISWSPNDRRIALQDDEVPRGDGHIVIVTVATGVIDTIAPHGRAYFDETPSWSSDGYIYFQSNRSGVYAIYRMHPDGSDQQRLTP